MAKEMLSEELSARIEYEKKTLPLLRISTGSCTVPIITAIPTRLRSFLW